MDFRKYIKTKVIKKTDRILEFGPLIRPLGTKKDYPCIEFADVKSTKDIQKLYTSNDYLKATGLEVDINQVVPIDHVITKSYTETFKGKPKFDVVYLSHVIEHMPNIIDFFQDVSSVVAKDGKLVLVYPDARYCFDHFRNGTTFIDAYDVYKHNIMNAKAVFDFTYNVVAENNPAFFWGSTKIVDILPKNTFGDAVKSYDKSLVNELPDDVHFWPFSDYQFVKFLYDMDRAGLLNFEITDFHETEMNNQEFMVVLSPKKGKEPNYKKFHEILAKISPAVKINTARLERQQLADRITELELVAKELEEIKSSRKWRLAQRLANIKRAVLRQNNG